MKKEKIKTNNMVTIKSLKDLNRPFHPALGKTWEIELSDGRKGEVLDEGLLNNQYELGLNIFDSKSNIGLEVTQDLINWIDFK